MQDDEKKPEDKTDRQISMKEKAKRGGQVSVIKMEAKRALKEYSNPDSKWDLIQELYQEIQALYISVNPDQPMPTVPKLRQHLIDEIKLRYEDEPELRDLLLQCLPSTDRYIRAWYKKEGWMDAVWDKVRVKGLFTESKRSQVIEALRKRAIEKDTAAAKIWLQLSGDLVENNPIAASDKAQDFYREINKILHSKKGNE